jgi:hypothetical protein
MEFKWQSMEVADQIEYSETKQDEKDREKITCVSHTQDCGTIRKQSKCQCGKHKNTGHSLCITCHSILPEDLKEDVNWCPEIYEAAIQYLTQ